MEESRLMAASEILPLLRSTSKGLDFKRIFRTKLSEKKRGTSYQSNTLKTRIEGCFSRWHNSFLTQLIIIGQQPSSGFFGVTLDHLVIGEHSKSQPPIPFMQMIRYLGQEGKRTEHRICDFSFVSSFFNLLFIGLQTQGLFRIAGSAQRMKFLQLAIDDKGKIESFEGLTVHDVAGTFKLFFRLLPEPLFTFKLYKLFLVTERK